MRPKWEDMPPGVLVCTCGDTLWMQQATREHWQAGHFDYTIGDKMKLFLEIDTDEELNAPLSEAELETVEKSVAKVRAGDLKTTNDPAVRDQWEAESKGKGVLWYRKPSRQEVPDEVVAPA